MNNPSSGTFYEIMVNAILRYFRTCHPHLHPTEAPRGHRCYIFFRNFISASYKLFPRVTNYFRELQIISASYKTFPRVIIYFRELQNISASYNLFPRVTKKFRKLQNISARYFFSASYKLFPRLIKLPPGDTWQGRWPFWRAAKRPYVPYFRTLIRSRYWKPWLV